VQRDLHNIQETTEQTYCAMTNLQDTVYAIGRTVNEVYYRRREMGEEISSIFSYLNIDPNYRGGEQ